MPNFVLVTLHNSEEDYLGRRTQQDRPFLIDLDNVTSVEQSTIAGCTTVGISNRNYHTIKHSFGEFLSLLTYRNPFAVTIPEPTVEQPPTTDARITLAVRTSAPGATEWGSTYFSTAVADTPPRP